MTCVAAAALTPSLPPPAASQAIPVALTSVAQPFDLLDPALASMPLPVADLPEAAGLFGLGGFYLSLIGLFNEAVSIITTPISWVPIVGSMATSVIWMPINLVENTLALLLVGSITDTYYPYAAVDVGELAGPIDLPALSDLTLPGPLLDLLP